MAAPSGSDADGDVVMGMVNGLGGLALNGGAPAGAAAAAAARQPALNASAGDLLSEAGLSTFGLPLDAAGGAGASMQLPFDDGMGMVDVDGLAGLDDDLGFLELFDDGLSPTTPATGGASTGAGTMPAVEDLADSLVVKNAAGGAADAAGRFIGYDGLSASFGTARGAGGVAASGAGGGVGAGVNAPSWHDMARTTGVPLGAAGSRLGSGAGIKPAPRVTDALALGTAPSLSALPPRRPPPAKRARTRYTTTQTVTATAGNRRGSRERLGLGAGAGGAGGASNATSAVGHGASPSVARPAAPGPAPGPGRPGLPPRELSRKSRKNNRERQRRMEVNESFDDLATLLQVERKTKSDKVTVLRKALDEIVRLRAEVAELRALGIGSGVGTETGAAHGSRSGSAAGSAVTPGLDLDLGSLSSPAPGALSRARSAVPAAPIVLPAGPQVPAASMPAGVPHPATAIATGTAIGGRAPAFVHQTQFGSAVPVPALTGSAPLGSAATAHAAAASFQHLLAMQRASEAGTHRGRLADGALGPAPH